MTIRFYPGVSRVKGGREADKRSHYGLLRRLSRELDDEKFRRDWVPESRDDTAFGEMQEGRNPRYRLPGRKALTQKQSRQTRVVAIARVEWFIEIIGS